MTGSVKPQQAARVLIIAGSDPSGGAGVQADIKTVTALGGYAAAVVTALTVQNTQGVSAVHPVEPSVIRDQIFAVLDDIGADAIKIGMIGEVAAAEAIADALAEWGGAAPIVLDPVLIATSGDALAGAGVAAALIARLLPIAHVATPNAPELAALSGMPVTTDVEARRAGEALIARTGLAHLLAKGGHLPGADVVDQLIRASGSATIFRNPRIDTTSTHGTGCTLATALATGLAQGMALDAAAGRAIAYVRAAIMAAPGLGAGRGPLGHAHTVREEWAAGKERAWPKSSSD